ncbi:MAG: phosphodiester glycosidase family protein [Bacilli bacterium]|nr:phosphodiester glycosidase family protein [Bacilli bacterium]
MKRSTILLILMDLIAIVCFIIVYGPNDNFRTYFVTTAMETKSHRYLARVFYSENTIESIISSNKTIVVNETTDTSLINFGTQADDIIYDSIYEEQILNRDPDDVYKIIEFDGNGYHAYLTVIYDPSRVTTTKSAYYGYRGEYLSTMAAKSGALVAINGGAFVDVNGEGDGALAAGIFISNGEVIENYGGAASGVIGITNDNVLTLGYMTAQQAINMGIRDAVYFGPFLIVNGKSSQILGNGGYGVNPRTAIAQRKDGIMLFLTIDGSGSKYGFRGGATMSEMISILERYGAYNAANLDGGASVVLAVNGKAYNEPVAYSASGERWLPNGWIVK